MNRRRCVLRRSTLRRIIVVASCVLLVVPLTACQVELSTSLTVSDNGSGQLGQRQTVLPLVLRGLSNVYAPSTTPGSVAV